MPTLTVTAKGQVTLRKDILNHLGIHPGDQITVEKRPGGRLEVRAARPAGQIPAVFNMLKRPETPAVSIDEMNRVIAEGWTGER
ncbi:MAG: AbrB/MazE/SpoVT family DNA-binding domain-containing protein [Acetobacteraceae bacterium]